MFDSAKTASGCGNGGDPLGRRDLVADISPNDGGGGDIDHDGELTNLEFLLFLVGPLQAEGLNNASVAQDCVIDAADALPAAGTTRCATDRTGAERDLTRALAYAQALQLGLPPFVDALDFCRIDVQVTPASVTLVPGTAQQFAERVTGTLDPGNEGVTWSTTGGGIDASGNYTAPSTPGTYVVTAASVLNPQRTGAATVTVPPPAVVEVEIGCTHCSLSPATVTVAHGGSGVLDQPQQRHRPPGKAADPLGSGFRWVRRGLRRGIVAKRSSNAADSDPGSIINAWDRPRPPSTASSTSVDGGAS